MGELIGADVWAAYSVMTYLFNVTPPSIIFTLSLHDALPISLGALAFLGGTFMPDFREGHFVMQVSSSITGTSLEQMLALGKRVSTEVLALPYVKSIEQQIGRAELSEDTWGPHRSEFHVELKPDGKVNQEAAQEELRGILERYP